MDEKKALKIAIEDVRWRMETDYLANTSLYHRGHKTMQTKRAKDAYEKRAKVIEALETLLMQPKMF